MAGKPRLTGVLIGAAVVMLLGAPYGLLLAIGSSMNVGFAEIYGSGLTFMDRILVVISYVAVVLAVANLVAGVAMLVRTRWARNLGLGVSVAWQLIGVVLLFDDFPDDLFWTLIFVGVYGFVEWALLRNAEPAAEASDTAAEAQAGPAG